MKGPFSSNCILLKGCPVKFLVIFSCHMISSCVCLGTRVFRIVLMAWGPGCVHMGRVTSPCIAGLALLCTQFRVILCLCLVSQFFQECVWLEGTFRNYPTEPVDLFGKVSSEAHSSGFCHLILQDALPLLCSFKIVKSDWFFYQGGWHRTPKPRTHKGFFISKKKHGFLTWKRFVFILNMKSAPISFSELKWFCFLLFKKNYCS